MNAPLCDCGHTREDHWGANDGQADCVACSCASFEAAPISLGPDYLDGAPCKAALVDGLCPAHGRGCFEKRSWSSMAVVEASR